MEQANSVAAPADTGDTYIRQPPHFVEHLLARFYADHALEITHHHRVRVRPQRRAEQVERIAHIRDPITNRLVDRVLQRLAAALHRDDLRAEQFHAKDVRLLAGDVHTAHVNVTVQTE